MVIAAEKGDLDLGGLELERTNVNLELLNTRSINLHPAHTHSLQLTDIGRMHVLIGAPASLGLTAVRYLV